MPEQWTRRVTAILLSSMLLIASPSVASAQPEATGASDVVQNVEVTLRTDGPSLSPTDTFALDVETRLSAPAEYFEVRVRVWRPNGVLMYQKTEVRHDVEAGTLSVGFERALEDLSVALGRYPMEVRVLASGAEPTVVESRVLVADETLEPLPVTVLARLVCSPALDPSGRFTLDPATHDSQRAAAEELSVLAAGRDVSLSVALPPLMLEEWSRIASGYQLSGAEGVVDVPADSDVSKRYAGTIDLLSRAARTGQIELVDVPYAEPDLGGLERLSAIDDLSLHYRRGRSVYQAVLGATPSKGTALLGDVVTASAANVMAETDHGYVICSPRSSADTTAPGVYREEETGIVTLILDADLSGLAQDGTAEEVYDHLYDAATAEERPSAVVIVLDIGPGRTAEVDDVRRILSIADGVEWLEPVSVARAAQMASTGTLSLKSKASTRVGAPRGYWDDVSEARTYALGLEEAWGAEDADSDAVITSVLISESAAWAGPDGSYPFADRGRAFATTVTDLAEELFSGIHLEARDVTLAARSGDVPLTIVSANQRAMKLEIETLADSIEPGATRRTVTVQPADNFLTIPVDLGASVSDDLVIRVLAGDVLVAESTVAVRASYLDRLTTMAAVVIVLAALLLFIRRRVSTADADNIRIDANDSDGSSAR